MKAQGEEINVMLEPNQTCRRFSGLMDLFALAQSITFISQLNITHLYNYYTIPTVKHVGKSTTCQDTVQQQELENCPELSLFLRPLRLG